MSDDDIRQLLTDLGLALPDETMPDAAVEVFAQLLKRRGWVLLDTWHAFPRFPRN